MGHRANYIWTKDNQTHFATSRFGAITIPNDFFWGPEKTLSWLESLDEVVREEDLYGFPWVEGGVLLNMDTKRLFLQADTWETTLHKETDLEDRWLNVQSPYLVRMFRAAWEGWHVDIVSNVYVSPWIQGARADIRNPLNFARQADPDISEGVGDWLPQANRKVHGERFARLAELLLSYRSDILGGFVSNLQAKGHDILSVAHDDVMNRPKNDKEPFVQDVIRKVFQRMDEEGES